MEKDDKKEAPKEDIEERMVSDIAWDNWKRNTRRARIEYAVALIAKE